MGDFFRGPYETAVEHGEILTEVRIPFRPHGSSAYAKVERRAGDWAVTSAGAAVWMDGSVIADARVGLAAVGANTTGLSAISEALSGREPSEELYAQAGSIAAESCSPVTDSRGTADYKRHLADELTRRTLRRSVERIRAGEAGDRAGGPREDQGGDG
jgi:carbon-monoxide dehydrogenase medium subunit